MAPAGRIRLLQAGAIVFWAAFNLPSLLSYPTPHPDEAWYSSNGYNLIRHGQPGVPIFGDHFGLDRNNTFDGKLYLAGVGLVHALFGVGLWQARLFALAGGALAGWLVWEAGRRAGGEGAGALGGLLFLFSWRTFYAAHRGRPEIWMAAAGAGLLWGLERARESRRPWAMALLGFAAAAAIDIHLPAAHYLVAAATVVGLDALQSREGRARAGRFALGAALGLGWAAAAHLLPDPALTVLQWTHGKPGTPVLEQGYGLAYRLAGASAWLRAGTVGYTRLGWLEAAAIVGAAGALLWRRRPDDARLLIFGGATLASFSLLMVSKPLYYIALAAPIFSLILTQGAFAAGGFAAHLRGGRMLPWLCGGALLAAYAGGDAALAWGNRAISFSAYSRALRQLVPAEGGMAGEGTWWFAFADRRYTTDDYLYQGARDESEDPAEWLRRVFSEREIRIVLQDEALSAFPSASFVGDQARRQAAFEALLAEACTPLGAVAADFYGIDHGGLRQRRTVVWSCPAFAP